MEKKKQKMGAVPKNSPHQLVEKAGMPQILCKSLAEFRRPQTTESSPVCFFRGHVPRKKHCSGRKRASRGPKQSPAKRVCLGEEGQGSGAMPGRQARMSGVDFAPTKCDAAGCNPSSTCLHVRESLSTLSTGSEGGSTEWTRPLCVFFKRSAWPVSGI